MFTGLIQKIGTLKRLQYTQGGWALTVAHEPWPDALTLGESVAVQGACLTASAIGDGWFVAEILDETLQRTALRNFHEGAGLNLERALAVGDRFGGHIVSGHVDETGILLDTCDRGRDIVWRVSCSPTLARQTVMKGSITIDGVSLTVSGLGDDWLEVNLIPHTLNATTLRDRRTGDPLNLEGDILGKYVARILGKTPTGITEDTLRENGFM